MEKIEIDNVNYFLTLKIKYEENTYYKLSNINENIFCTYDGKEYTKVKDKKLIKRLKQLISIKSDIV